MGARLAMSSPMKMNNRLRTAALTLCAALMVTACSSSAGKQTTDGASLGKAVFDQFMSRRNAAPQQQVDLATMLQTSRNALAILALENSPAPTLLQETERGSGAQVFETAAGQSVTAKRGLVIATRGLGQDLIATEAHGTAKLIAQRTAGSAQRRMEYLNGAGETVTLRFDCQIKRDRIEPIDSGVIKTTGRLMVEDCNGAGGSFRNTYLVANDGYILSSRQWLHPQLGSATFQMLKR